MSQQDIIIELHCASSVNIQRNKDLRWLKVYRCGAGFRSLAGKAALGGLLVHGAADSVGHQGLGAAVAHHGRRAGLLPGGVCGGACTLLIYVTNHCHK